ncbi:16S rRNA (cytosine(967)-C(5))-methyltransferase RsmB [Pseudomarimonas salicorniae]|uniref:16S rRNA (cytosine(967)-C(5))-methyltransferase n=1 Tax=Pseudomarimonas salicorniae TaxID=2933270 RepID=A0ABT0GKK0_9GAMM|nr:16S rRNA (cytosine(967)-C(5))-methyltransferase RsmB [Lysobacter sp. CAU 1642]MCK7595074.1 16S rRNA (cytosine(967)-C(5))-methyltransferase RsmB [Lysobacter sp. CAU 1642]
MAKPGVLVRQLAAEALAEVVGDGRSLRAVLPEPLRRLADPRDRALLEAMLFEACRWQPRYERVLAGLLDRPLPAKQRRIQALLLVGLAQLEALRMAPHAVISSTAEVARAWKQPGMVGLVNALLRRWCRDEATIAARCEADPVARLAHPRWLIERIRSDWPEQAETLLAANNRPGPLWLRLHPRAGSVEDYLRALQAEGITAAAGPDGWPRAVCIDPPVAPERLPGWSEGQVAVQDAAAQAVATALPLSPGLRVLDACAAPGGKTAALLEVEPALDLLALDRDPQRLARMQSGLARLGHAPVMRAADAARPGDWWDGRPFDLILLDVPCSATGVIRRQPDIKLHRRPADIDALCAQQAALLEAAWGLLAPGGRLLYTTCSLLREENAGQIEAFLERHAEAERLALPSHLGHPCGSGRQRLPGEQQMDGFFYAALGKPR